MYNSIELDQCREYYKSVSCSVDYDRWYYAQAHILEAEAEQQKYITPKTTTTRKIKTGPQG